jgi:hypothetical protein
MAVQPGPRIAAGPVAVEAEECQDGALMASSPCVLISHFHASMHRVCSRKRSSLSLLALKIAFEFLECCRSKLAYNDRPGSAISGPNKPIGTAGIIADQTSF